MSKLSYFRNTQKYDFIFDTIGSRVRYWAKIQPNKAALVVHMSDVQRSFITFGELYEKAESLAKYYVSVGIRPGDRVAVFVYNSTEWLITSIAGSLAGAVSINSFTFASQKDLDLVRTIGCKLLVADMRDEKLKHFMTRNIEDLRSKGFALKVITVEDHNHVSAENNFHKILTDMKEKDVSLPDGIDPEDLTVVFQTSGSTGVPKFVPYSHMAIINDLLFLCTAMGIENRDIFFSDRPMGYMAGYPMVIMVLGCTFVTLNSQSTVRDGLSGQVCKILKQEAVTCGYFPPYLVHDLDKLKHTASCEIPFFKAVVTSGQRLSKKILRRFQEYSERPCLGYGTTEVAWVTLSSVDELPDIDDDIIGSPLPATEMKIVDEHNRVVPVNTYGEICVRNISTAKNYLTTDGEFVKLTDENGWFHTGDIGYMLDDGKNFCIKGRAVEIIKRSTIKIFPASIETVLSKHPAVAEAVVVGVPDDRMYQDVCACVTVKVGQELTVAELESYGMEQFKPDSCPDGKGLMPGYFVIFETFPRLSSQKVNRRKTTEMAIELTSTKSH
ncbi:medium-chain acyl-CoA ligase ACSF2, mitochondrial-like [Liolophura sinensis]|uniref:medium-chain acyl-CoA ligase ACSF2, mitochondrial-like n=1 Tax=Liolophura sinensis TaxID=3198878 RepID=UPI003158938A